VPVSEGGREVRKILSMVRGHDPEEAARASRSTPAWSSARADGRRHEQRGTDMASGASKEGVSARMSVEA
jgi:hypothetical protein